MQIAIHFVGKALKVARWFAARMRSPAYEIWLAPEQCDQLGIALLAAGATPVGSEALELHRIVSGIPRYGVDIRERDLPQETEQARALNFNKGCYVGQEIVERIRSRGAVHRKFTGFVAADGPRIIPGTQGRWRPRKKSEKLRASPVIALTTAARRVALGYIRREAGSGREVMIGSSEGDCGCSCLFAIAHCSTKPILWNSVRLEQTKSGRNFAASRKRIYG